jgi:glycosyltransferase involved in cell wall biosynthesis
VLTSADRVVVVGKTMAERFRHLAGIEAAVVPNGYDEEDFTGSTAGEPEKQPDGSGARFNLVHVGAMNRDRNHPVFWECLASLIREDPDFERELTVTLVGKVDHSVQRSLAEYRLDHCTEVIPSLPHNQVIPLLQSATVLYLPINNTPNARSIATGKIFEYLSAGRPILGVGPVDGDAAEILKSCQAGEMIDFTDGMEMKKILSGWAVQHRAGRLAVRPSNIDRYSRRNLTANYAELLQQVIQPK